MIADEIKHRLEAKFESKVLVWIAISSMGVSKPFFAPSKQAINQEIYLMECIKRRLIPFVKKHTNFTFGQILLHLTMHIASLTTFVEKLDNPANVSEARPIEDFWGDLKREVYKGNWSATTIPQLKRRICYCLGKMDLKKIHLQIWFI